MIGAPVSPARRGQWRAVRGPAPSAPPFGLGKNTGAESREKPSPPFAQRPAHSSRSSWAQWFLQWLVSGFLCDQNHLLSKWTILPKSVLGYLATCSPATLKARVTGFPQLFGVFWALSIQCSIMTVTQTSLGNIVIKRQPLRPLLTIRNVL